MVTYQESRHKYVTWRGSLVLAYGDWDYMSLLAGQLPA